MTCSRQKRVCRRDLFRSQGEDRAGCETSTCAPLRTEVGIRRTNRSMLPLHAFVHITVSCGVSDNGQLLISIHIPGRLQLILRATCYSCVLLIIGALLYPLSMLLESAETTAMFSPAPCDRSNRSSFCDPVPLKVVSAIDRSASAPRLSVMSGVSPYSRIIPLSNIARNCFRHGSVVAMFATWVAIVVVNATDILA